MPKPAPKKAIAKKGSPKARTPNLTGRIANAPPTPPPVEIPIEPSKVIVVRDFANDCPQYGKAKQMQRTNKKQKYPDWAVIWCLVRSVGGSWVISSLTNNDVAPTNTVYFGGHELQTGSIRMIDPPPAFTGSLPMPI